MYDGPLDRKKMSGPVRAAYVSWCNQNIRCNQPKCPNYRWYGAKGVRVKYGARDFINWWLKNLNGRKGTLVCDRIDPDGHYEFANIQLVTHQQNRKRVRQFTVPVIWHSEYGDIYFESMTEARIGSGYWEASIWRHCSGFYKKRLFSYAGKTKGGRSDKYSI